MVTLRSHLEQSMLQRPNRVSTGSLILTPTITALKNEKLRRNSVGDADDKPSALPAHLSNKPFKPGHVKSASSSPAFPNVTHSTDTHLSKGNHTRSLPTNFEPPPSSSSSSPSSSPIPSPVPSPMPSPSPSSAPPQPFSSSSLLVAIKGYGIEEGHAEVVLNSSSMVIKDKLKSEPWYSAYFFEKSHYNYIGEDNAFGTYIVSVISDDASDGSYNFRAIVRTKEVCLLDSFVYSFTDVCEYNREMRRSAVC
jgi:hypothetical protein